MVISRDVVDDPKQYALYVSAVLAADKGIPSEIVEIPNGYKVVTDDDREIIFSTK